MTDITSQVSAILTNSTVLAANPVARFCYTATAYDNNVAAGVSSYSATNEQNIPLADYTDTDSAVLDSGFRATAASIPRMYINHFMGRLSYNLNKTVDFLNTFYGSYLRDIAQNCNEYSSSTTYQSGDVCFQTIVLEGTLRIYFFQYTAGTAAKNIPPMSTSGVVDTANWTLLIPTTDAAHATGVLPVANGGTGESTVDTVPTAGSTKMVTSGGVRTALDSNSTADRNLSNATGVLAVANGGTGNTTGNAASATKLATARTIGGVSFDGSANINLPGVNAAGNQNTTGNAATADALNWLDLGDMYTYISPDVYYYWKKIGTFSGSQTHACFEFLFNGDYYYPVGNHAFLYITELAGTSLSLRLTSDFYDSQLIVAIDDSYNIWIQCKTEWNSRNLYRIIDGSSNVSSFTTGDYSAFGTVSGFTSIGTIQNNGRIRIQKSDNSISLHITNQKEEVSPILGSLIGNVTGNAASATQLATSRTLTTNLASTTGASFDGTDNASIGVTGVLPVANGGTGNSTVDTTPTAGSTKMVTSDGIKNAIDIRHLRVSLKHGEVFSDKTWAGNNSFSGDNVWTDGNSVYYSLGPTHFVLDVATSTWVTKTWLGLTSFNGANVWTDGINVYYSSAGSNYVLNTTDYGFPVWQTKTWSGLTVFLGSNVWSDGTNTYYSDYSGDYVLNVSTSTWSTKTWIGLTKFTGAYVWSDGTSIYWSYNGGNYVLNTATSTWTAISTFSDITAMNGLNVWTDGINVYYSWNGESYILNKDTKVWSEMSWVASGAFSGAAIWTDGTNIYWSSNGNNYVLSCIRKYYISQSTSKSVDARGKCLTLTNRFVFDNN